MTDEEKLEEHKKWAEMIRDALAPLLAEEKDKPGIIALRLFYTVLHKDGTRSGGNVGATTEVHKAAGVELQTNILGLMMDLDGNREQSVMEVTKKS